MMNNPDVVFRAMREERYSSHEIAMMLERAQAMGLPLDKGSYLEKMTIAQLVALVEGKTDA